MESKSSDERAAKSFYCFLIFRSPRSALLRSSTSAGFQFQLKSFRSILLLRLSLLPESQTTFNCYFRRALSHLLISRRNSPVSEFYFHFAWPESRKSSSFLSRSVEKAFKNLLHFQIAFGSPRAPQLLLSSEGWQAKKFET
jgi:hypothetical protein